MIACTRYFRTSYDAGSSGTTSYSDNGTCDTTTTFYQPYYIYDTARYYPDEVIETLAKYSGPSTPFKPYEKSVKLIAIKPWQKQSYYGRK